MDIYMGTILLFAFPYAPMGFYLCDGRSLPVAQNQALYSLLGFTYGGDGRNNFNIPDLRGASPVPGMNYYIAYQGLYPSRDD